MFPCFFNFSKTYRRTICGGISVNLGSLFRLIFTGIHLHPYLQVFTQHGSLGSGKGAGAFQVDDGLFPVGLDAPLVIHILQGQRDVLGGVGRVEFLVQIIHGVEFRGHLPHPVVQAHLPEVGKVFAGDKVLMVCDGVAAHMGRVRIGAGADNVQLPTFAAFAIDGGAGSGGYRLLGPLRLLGLLGHHDEADQHIAFIACGSIGGDDLYAQPIAVGDGRVEGQQMGFGTVGQALRSAVIHGNGGLTRPSVGIVPNIVQTYKHPVFSGVTGEFIFQGLSVFPALEIPDGLINVIGIGVAHLQIIRGVGVAPGAVIGLIRGVGILHRVGVFCQQGLNVSRERAGAAVYEINQIVVIRHRHIRSLQGQSGGSHQGDCQDNGAKQGQHSLVLFHFIPSFPSWGLCPRYFAGKMFSRWQTTTT